MRARCLRQRSSAGAGLPSTVTSTGPSVRQRITRRDRGAGGSAGGARSQLRCADDPATRHRPPAALARELGADDRLAAVPGAEVILPDQAEAEVHRRGRARDLPIAVDPLPDEGAPLPGAEDAAETLQ